MTGMNPRRPTVLQTTRIRGGTSWRLAAVAIAAVLGLVAWIGTSGPHLPVAPSRAPEAAQIPTASPSAPADPVSTSQPRISPTPQPAPTPLSAVASIERDDLSVVATIGRRQFMAWLRPAGPGHLSGTFRLPIPPPATAGTLELEQVWRTVAQAWRTPSHDAWATLGTWDLHLETISDRGEREYVLLDRFVPAQPMVRDLSLLVTHGYRITVRAHSGAPLGLVTVDIQIVGGNLERWDGTLDGPVVAAVGSELLR